MPKWLQSILTLIPYIAAGVNVVHADLDGPGKVAAAGDALQIATMGATASLTGNDAVEAQEYGTLAQKLLASTVTMLHNATTPAPVAVATPIVSNAPAN